MITVHRKSGVITKIEADPGGKAAMFEEFSRLMKRYEKAQAYMESKKIPASEKEMQVSNLKALMQEISVMLLILERAGEDWKHWIK